MLKTIGIVVVACLAASTRGRRQLQQWQPPAGGPGPLPELAIGHIGAPPSGIRWQCFGSRRNRPPSDHFGMRRGDWRRWPRRSGMNIPNHRHRRLLRSCRERPRHRRAADQRDELAAAHHSITSSAVASSLSGTVRPRFSRSGGFQLELARLNDGQVSRLGTLEDAASIDADLPVRLGDIASIGQQPANVGKFTVRIDRGNRVRIASKDNCRRRLLRNGPSR